MKLNVYFSSGLKIQLPHFRHLSLLLPQTLPLLRIQIVTGFVLSVQARLLNSY